jgi:hypothetical protein
MTGTREREAVAVPGRRRLRRVVTWVGIALVVAVVAIAGYWALARSGAAPSPPPINVPTPSPQTIVVAPPTPAEGSTAAADGCLGGPDPFAAILPAQAAASMDQDGAAAFALAYLRYVGQFPADPSIDAVLPLVTTAGFHAEIAPKFEQLTNAATAAGAEVGTFEFRLVPGAPTQYRVVGGDPGGESVSLNVAFTREFRSVDGTSARETKVSTVIVDAVDGHWVVAANVAPELADPFAPVAGAPWVSYAGVC